MDIKEILALDKTMANAKKIDHFLSKKDKYTTEYLKAFCYKMIIWGENNRLNEALKEVYSYVPYFSEMIDEDVIIICDTIMHITLRAGRLDEYQKYLQVKIGRLPSRRAKEKYLDSFYYYKALKDYNQARINALEYAKFNNTKEEMIKIELELLEIAELLRDEETFNKVRNTLEELLKDSFDFDLIANFHIRVLRMLYTLRSYSEAKSFLVDFLNDPHINKDLEIEAAAIYLKIILLEKDYKKGTIIEAKYSEDLSLAKPEVALEFARASKKLYEALDHKLSIDYYNNIIEKSLLKLKQAQKAKKTNKEDLIVIPDLLVERPVAKNKVSDHNLSLVRAEINNEVKINLSEDMDKLLKGLTKLLNYDLPLRDSIREGTSILADIIGISELDLLYFENKYYLHKYKNKRVYDRSYPILPPSFQTKAIENNDIIFLAKEGLSANLDLFYQKPIEYDYAISFPLVEKDRQIGALTIYSNTNLLEDPNLFTLGAILKNSYNLLLLHEINKKRLERQNGYVDYIFKVTDQGFRIIGDNSMELSDEGAYLLGLDKHASLKEFYNGLREDAKNSFEGALNNLRNNPVNNLTITYPYNINHQTKYFKETFYTYFKDELKILSFFEDITASKDNEGRLLRELYYNSETNIKNKKKLILDIKEYKERFSLSLIRLYNFKNYQEIYGYGFYDAFIKAFTKSLKDYFKNKYYVEIYQLNDWDFALMLKGNDDKRLLQSKLRDLLGYLEVSLVDFNYNIEPHYNMGVLRLDGKNNININEALTHLYDAYLLALEEYKGTSNYAFFSLDSYKKHFKNRVIETNIAEALDTNKIEVLYQQIVDIKNMEVYGYYAKLNIIDETFKEEEINKIIKLKSFTNRLDKYKLMHVASDLKDIYKELKGYFEIFLEINSLAIDKSFISFLKSQLSFFKIPANMLNIIVDEYSDSLEEVKALKVGLVTKNIYDIINHKASLLLVDYKAIGEEELGNLVSFLASYKAKLILANVNTKDISSLNAEGIDYIFGDVYKKSYKMADLIAKLKE